MPRTKTGTARHRSHKKLLDMNKGYRGSNSRLVKRAKEASLHAGQYAFIGRKLRKRDMRSLWILRISAALKQAEEAINYSRFIKAMKDKNVQIDRKILADLAVSDFATFKTIVQQVAGK